MHRCRFLSVIPWHRPPAAQARFCVLCFRRCLLQGSGIEDEQAHLILATGQSNILSFRMDVSFLTGTLTSKLSLVRVVSPSRRPTGSAPAVRR